MKQLEVRGRYLAYDDGTPFFYLGDTAWEIFHSLDREELKEYFAVRAEQGFTVVQGVALAELDGLRVPNAYGRLPLKCTDDLPDPEKPDTDGEYSYWDHVDFAVKSAAENGLFIAMLPTWGDKFNICWGKGPKIFTEENAYSYGKWIADRYKDDWNIIWMLGGDRPLEEKHRKIIDAMAKGIREVDPVHLITFHPAGCKNSTDFLNDADYIDFHTAQTGHGVETYDSDGMMLRMRAVTEKPYMDSEPRYEDHPACFNDRIGWFWDSNDVRQNAYWNVLCGTCGHTYGNHNVWSMNREPGSYFPFAWNEVLRHPGAEQMGFVKKLRFSRDYYSLRPAPEILVDNFTGMGHMAAAKGEDYAYIYSPLGIPFAVELDLFENSTQTRAIWFDPRTGEEQVFAILPGKGTTHLAPPTQGKGCDWVLVLEAVR